MAPAAMAPAASDSAMAPAASDSAMAPAVSAMAPAASDPAPAVSASDPAPAVSASDPAPAVSASDLAPAASDSAPLGLAWAFGPARAFGPAWLPDSTWVSATSDLASDPGSSCPSAQRSGPSPGHCLNLLNQSKQTVRLSDLQYVLNFLIRETAGALHQLLALLLLRLLMEGLHGLCVSSNLLVILLAPAHKNMIPRKFPGNHDVRQNDLYSTVLASTIAVMLPPNFLNSSMFFSPHFLTTDRALKILSIGIFSAMQYQ